MYTTFGAPSGAFGGSNGDQSGTESRMSTLILPLNGSLITHSSFEIGRHDQGAQRRTARRSFRPSCRPPHPRITHIGRSCARAPANPAHLRDRSGLDRLAAAACLAGAGPALVLTPAAALLRRSPYSER